MPRGRPKKIKIPEELKELKTEVPTTEVSTELNEMRKIHDFLISRGIHSISALENKISQMQ